LYEIYKIIFDIFLYIALIIDRLGNIIVGPLLGFLIIDKQAVPKKINIAIIDTKDKSHILPDIYSDKIHTFGLNDWTLSASIGRLIVRENINKRGGRFANIIDFVFGVNHCRNAYEFKIIKTSFSGNGTGIS
jgi:hypothetical protein